MKQNSRSAVRVVALPFSDGVLSARLWMSGDRTVVGVPELGLHCYGSSQPEAAFRLFNSMLKYYRQLRAHRNKLTQQGLDHLELLTGWVHHIEDRMKAPSDNVVSFTRR